jgi:hypothetical protein
MVRYNFWGAPSAWPEQAKCTAWRRWGQTDRATDRAKNAPGSGLGCGGVPRARQAINLVINSPRLTPVMPSGMMRTP